MQFLCFLPLQSWLLLSCSSHSLSHCLVVQVSCRILPHCFLFPPCFGWFSKFRITYEWQKNGFGMGFFLHYSLLSFFLFSLVSQVYDLTWMREWWFSSLFFITSTKWLRLSTHYLQMFFFLLISFPSLKSQRNDRKILSFFFFLSVFLAYDLTCMTVWCPLNVHFLLMLPSRTQLWQISSRDKSLLQQLLSSLITW